MKFYVLCVHWVLLFVFLTSSCALFLLVTAESVQSPKRFSYFVKDKANVTIDNNFTSNDISKKSSNFRSTEERKNEETDFTNHVAKERQTPSNNEKAPTEDAKNLDVFKETLSLRQNPNLSEGISETGQSVVLTLVDSAAAELQNFAEPKITTSNLSTKDTSKNGSSSSSSFPTMTSMPNVPKPIDQTTTNSPFAKNSEISGSEKNTSDPIETRANVENVPEVVVVRAEQMSGIPLTKVDEEKKFESDEDIPKIHQVFTTEPDLNDSAVRAQLTVEESSGVIFDSLVTSGSTDPHEDIPSFSEWTQKRLEEAEKKKTHPNVSVQNPGAPSRNLSGLKKRSKNYASPDCGAKIVATNPEARSARSVLAATRDEYMLNTCTSRVWFIVELCEAIQAKKIELANFELFSSSPKDFAVFVSDRFPSRDWSFVGQFTAREEKDIQSFNLHPHLFGKFIKVELQSHYGSEHFCPISLFRAYGTSEFEVLETETENHVQEHNQERDDEDDDAHNGDPDSEDDATSRNLFGSARDAVINIVKKATEVLVKSGNQGNANNTKLRENVPIGCGSWKYVVACENCTEARFSRVYDAVTCRSRELESLLETSFVKNNLGQGLCEGNLVFGRNLVAAFFGTEYVIALCNVLAMKEGRATLNPVHKNRVNGSQAKSTVFTEGTTSSVSLTTQTTCSVDTGTGKETEAEAKASVVVVDVPNGQEVGQIKPTKTVVEDEDHTEVPVLEPSKATVETSHFEVQATVPPLPTIVASVVKTSEEATFQTVVPEEPVSSPVEKVEKEVNVAENQEKTEGKTGKPEIKPGKVEVKTGKPEIKGDLEEDVTKDKDQDQMALDTILSELKEFEGEGMLGNGHSNNLNSAQPTASSTTPQQKESVFLRLSNRIKALEQNMSLSSQYLEELSRRYKKQVEEMQRSLERAIIAMSEESRKSEEREVKRLEEIAILKDEIQALFKSVERIAHERDSWHGFLSVVAQHGLFIFLDVVIVLLVLLYCRRAEEMEEELEEIHHRDIKRVTQRPKKRRPSEVASTISGTYQDLMIEDRALGEVTTKSRKKRRRKDFLGDLPGGASAPSRRASANEATESSCRLRADYLNGEGMDPSKSRIQIIKVEENNPLHKNQNYGKSSQASLASGDLSSKSSAIFKSAPSFMRTALVSRSLRMSFRASSVTSNTSGSTNASSSNVNGDSRNGHIDAGDDTLGSPKKEKRSIGLKKMVKKFF